MITACELCAKIEMIENEKKAKELKDSKAFIDYVLSPFIDNLTEIPKDLFVCYFWKNFKFGRGCFSQLSEDWEAGLTYANHPKHTRVNEMKHYISGTIDIDSLNDDIINYYLKDYGFKISIENTVVEVERYTTSHPNLTIKAQEIRLSMLCPLN